MRVYKTIGQRGRIALISATIGLLLHAFYSKNSSKFWEVVIFYLLGLIPLISTIPHSGSRSGF